jgi:hypothetical protein
MHKSLLVYNETVIHPIALVVTLIAGVLILALPRRHAIIPFLAAAIFIPLQQQIVVATLDFHMLRVLILFGWARLLIRSEFGGLKINAIDIILILWAVARIISYTLLWQTESALINRLGGSFDAIGIFFLMRHFIRDFADIEFVFKALIIICLPLAVAMLIERATGRNAFAIFGGVPEVTLIRDGRMRCQGAFKHPILAGTFGASLLPLFLSLWWRENKGKGFAIVGAVIATFISANTSSSGPAIALLCGLAAMGLWLFRKLMAVIAWLMVCGMFALQIVMDAPIWALMWRVKVFGASTSYHRYYLFDQFIRHFNDWWLVGTTTYASWGRQLFDMTNQFARIGVEGGIVTLLLFVALIVLCFRKLGNTVYGMEEQRGTQICLWALGASLFAHVVSFFGVSYFDQIIVIWYMLLALISTASVLASPVEQQDAEPGPNAVLSGISSGQYALNRS